MNVRTWFSCLLAKASFIIEHQFIPVYWCTLCQMPSMQLVCAACVANLARVSGNGICTAREHGYNYIDLLYCNFSYMHPLNKVLHALKYKRERKLHWALGYLLKFSLSQISGADLIIPLPLHMLRHKQRGFNQVKLLLKYYQSTMVVGPQINAHLVVRSRNTDSQVGLGQRLRHANVTDAFSLVNANGVRGLHVVIVDDVITTGATCNELARLLKQHGALRVDVCCLMKKEDGGAF